MALQKRIDTGKPEQAPAPEDEKSLRGAFASVMLMGGFLLLVWVGVFALFISRS